MSRMIEDGAREANEESDRRAMLAKLESIEREVRALFESGEAGVGMEVVKAWLRERLFDRSAGLIEPAAELYARLRKLELIEEIPLAPSHGYESREPP